MDRGNRWSEAVDLLWLVAPSAYGEPLNGAY